MLLHAEVALGRVLEVDPEIRTVVVLIWIVRMEIAIEACDFVFARLSKRTLLGSLLLIGRGNLGRRLWRDFERRGSRRLPPGLYSG